MKNFIDSEIKDSSIPIVEENVHIDKKIIEKGKVIISKSIKEESEIINLPVANEEVTIERVSINQILDKPPEAIRYEGNTVIVPVLQEITVIEKRILLVEEIRITKTSISSTETKEITLRKEEVKIERS
jgi:uncharacterized protein (TIGR02271 family)